jgi:hypothetical protein
MTLRTITPSGGAAQVTVSYGGSPGGPPCNATFTAGQVLDVPVGSPLETALAGNITALSGSQLTNDQGGLDPAATGNA